ncbi:aminotransferase class I/II-fold pyridoxal phosphate-dependent enzyme, partial [bacterium]|nr:aminotransferase class I/II-fold pyridoxal phosphate-dependent enzyme [bacterium]
METNTFDKETFAQLIPDYIQKLQPYVAGKPIWEVQAEYGLERVVKLASNENSLGPSHKALAAIRQRLSETYRYPDTGGFRLRSALAERFGVKVDNIILGNGSEGIMSYIMRTFLNQEDQVLSVDSTFVGFKVMAKARAEQPVFVPLNDYRFDLQALADSITERTKIVYLCNPNNPTGTYF